MSIFLCLVGVVILLVWMTVRWRLHPFLGLLFSAVAMGFLGGLDPSNTLSAISSGFGSTLQSIGIVIAAGAIIGEYLDRSGGASVLASRILKTVGEKKAALSMSLTGYIVSIPVFCDSGFIVLSSIKDAIAKKTGIPLAVLAIALASGLYATHVFVPPTPGPLAAAATLGADPGRVLILGLIVSVPVILAALAWATLFCGRFKLNARSSDTERVIESPPSFSLAVAPILLPILLIALKSVAEFPTAPLGSGGVITVISFLGNPVVALLTGVLLAFGLVRRPGANDPQSEWLEEALRKAGVIILITGAGGAFGSVLRETELGAVAAQFTAIGSLGVLLPFLTASFLKTAQGSSTVAIITAAAITAPLLLPLGLDSETGRACAVLAIGAGSLTVSHVNDSYFWVVAKFSYMDTATALKTHTAATLIMGLTGLLSVQMLVWILL